MNTPRPIRLLTDHFLWKLLSLALAAMLWIAVVDEPELTANVTAPVEFSNLAAGLDLGADVPDKVVLQLRGPRSRLALATGPRSAVVLNLLSQARPGERTFTVQELNLNLPKGVELVRAVPSQIRVVLENRLRKDVPVTLRFAGPPPVGYRVRWSQVLPERIGIVGPERHVREIEAIETDALDFGQFRGNPEKAAEVMLNAFVSDPLVSLATPSQIRARVQLEKIE
ncbi:MAG: hypothetical protein K2X03_10575 [Bryobacteraceae bacterium]|nr:hypothetical protein [Bryobacteraceae bacterium]